MLRNIHYRLTRLDAYRSFSRQQIRRLKKMLGCPDPWADLVPLLRAHPEAQYLDIGAHAGATIERICDECQNVVHGFEPTPASFQLLQEKYGGCPQVRLWNLACSNETGTSRIFLNNNSQTNSLLDNSDGNQRYFPQDTAHMGSVEISTIRLDDWLEDSQVGPKVPLVVKCDVQGAEMKVIEGGRQTLQNRCLAFYSEVQLVGMYENQATFHQVNQTLTDELGFVLKEIYPCLHDQTGRALQCDVLWVKPSVLKT